VDLAAIMKKKGEISRMSIKAALAAVAKTKGDPKLGLQIFNRQGCTVCHSLKKGEPLKGPFMGQVGSVLKRPIIAQSILQPNALISQGFKTVVIQKSDGETLIGFVTKRLSDQIELRTITGQVFRINPKEILSEKITDQSMMPQGLANGLSVKELASLVTFLEQQKK
jgi:putative heme-binding domain-containing protein